MAKLQNTTNKRNRIPKEQWLENMKTTRERLKKLSESVRAVVEAGEYPTINDAIICLRYMDGTHTEFKTFNQWRKEGYFVKLGQKGFPVWSRPVSQLKEEANKEAAPDHQEPIHEEDIKNFRVAYLFSNAQVAKETQRRKAAA